MKMDSNNEDTIDGLKILKKLKSMEFYNLLDNAKDLGFYLISDSYFYSNNAEFKKINKIDKYFKFFEENN